MRSSGRSSTASLPTIFFNCLLTRLDNMGVAAIVAKAAMRFYCIRGLYTSVASGKLLLRYVKRIQHQVVRVDEQDLLVVDDALLIARHPWKLPLTGKWK